MSRLRVSAIHYLNTAPLLWDFEHAPASTVLSNAYQLHYTSPAECAGELASGVSDIGIIPVAAWPLIPGLRIVPDIAIAARGPVRSILLICKKPIREVQTVALDTSSRTSSLLSRILFAFRWKSSPTFQPCAPALDQMLSAHDAALLIGDPALLVDRNRFEVFDLSSEWKEQTGLPFVFAFWAVREQALSRFGAEPIHTAFRESRDHGLANIDRITTEWVARIDLSATGIREYLENNIHYYLGPEELEGLRLFYRYAAELGELPLSRPLEFLAPPSAAVELSI